jgi:electron transport complex protein RnfC
MLKTFSGGVHPPESKDATEGLQTQAVKAPGTLYIPLLQHIGVPATAVVKPGDKVFKGTPVGEPGGYISAAVHSSVSGEVIAIEERPLGLGVAGRCVVIRNDFEERWADGCGVERDISKLDRAAIAEAVRGAGVVGMGGAAFPTDVKLSPPANKPVDTLIVNGAECEPYLTADHRLMIEEADAVVRGGDLARRAVGARSIVFAVEANKPDAFESLTKAAEAIGDAQVVMLPARYPQGGERQLIMAVLGREVPSGGLPMDAGAVVQNVATCAAIHEAVTFNRPPIERIVTVTGPCAAKPGNFRVRVGTTYAELIEVVGLRKAPRRIVMGGPMMGIAQRGVDIPVTKSTTGLVLLDEIPPDAWRACIRCGKCVRACPASIMPNELGVLIEARQFADAEAMDLHDCMECGSCTYVCPSKRPIVNWVKEAKAETASRRAAAQHARMQRAAV